MVSNLQHHMLAPSAASPMTSGRFFARDRHLERRLPVSGLERCPGCHPERSEGSLCPASQTLRGVYPERSEWAQGDRRYLQMSAESWQTLTNSYVFTRLKSYCNANYLHKRVFV